jgi:hypothetical protein
MRRFACATALDCLEPPRPSTALGLLLSVSQTFRLDTPGARPDHGVCHPYSDWQVWRVYMVAMAPAGKVLHLYSDASVPTLNTLALLPRVALTLARVHVKQIRLQGACLEGKLRDTFSRTSQVPAQRATNASSPASVTPILHTAR